MDQLIGRKVRYLDNLQFEQIGTIVGYKNSNVDPDILLLFIRNDKRDDYNLIDFVDQYGKLIKIEGIFKSDVCQICD